MKAPNAAQSATTHDWDEDATTRDLFVDLVCKEAGWAPGNARDREFKVSGIPRTKCDGTAKDYVDYVV